MDSFYIESEDFINYGVEHFSVVIFMAVFGIWFLRKGKREPDVNQKWKYALWVAIFAYFTQLFKVFFRMYLGTFDATKDLPLQLCNILPLLMIIGLWKHNRTLLGVIFFWIMAGTIQSNITPDVKNVLPHYDAIRYWVIHSGLPILAIYTIYVLGYRYDFKDALRSAVFLNILAAIIYPFNLWMGSNYLYLNGKPAAGTLYDLLGPWPWYILSLEGVMLILFSFLVLLIKWLSPKTEV